MLLVGLTGGPLLVLAYFLARRTARLRVGLCERHRRRRSRATMVFVAIGTLSAVGCAGSMFDARAEYLALPSALGILAALVYTGVGAPVLKASSISADRIEVQLDGPFFASLPGPPGPPLT